MIITLLLRPAILMRTKPPNCRKAVKIAITKTWVKTASYRRRILVLNYTVRGEILVKSEFLESSFKSYISGATDEEIKVFLSWLVGSLHHDRGMESLERYNLVLSAVKEEIDFEIESLKPFDDDFTIQAGCDLGISLLEPLRDAVSEALECAVL